MREEPAVLWKWTLIITAGIADAWLQIPHIMRILLVLMACDIGSGIIAAAITKRVQSSVMWVGLLKKIALFPMLWALHMVEEPMNLPVHLDQMAAFAYIVYEIMSIVENAAISGVPVPSAIIQMLAKAKVQTSTPEEIAQEFQRKITQVDRTIVDSKGRESTTSTHTIETSLVAPANGPPPATPTAPAAKE